MRDSIAVQNQRSRMKHRVLARTGRTILCGLVLFLLKSPQATAESISATPSSGIVVLFGDTYVFSGIPISGTAFAGEGSVSTSPVCGTGLGFYQGASVASDRLYISDECDSDGEDTIILTGTTGDYLFTAAASSSFAVNRGSGGNNPAAVDWITEEDAGSNSDVNIAVVIASPRELRGLDSSGCPWPNYDTPVDQDDILGLDSASASCTNSTQRADGLSPTRLYVGGVQDVGGKHFAYRTFDVTAGSFIGESVFLDGIGVPDGSGANEDKDLRGLASDGTNYYVAARKPGVDELWLYKYTTFPDSTPGSDLVHPDASPEASQLDGINGIAFPLNNRPQRCGLACGRRVDMGGGQLKPVFYVLAEDFLYSLVPTVLDPCDPPTAVCRNISRSISPYFGEVIVTPSDIDDGSTASHYCTISAIEISRDGGASFWPSVAFDTNDIATSPHTVTLRITQSDTQEATCTAQVTLDLGVTPPCGTVNPASVVSVAAGGFWMGQNGSDRDFFQSNSIYEDEVGIHWVDVPAFEISETEVTNAEYAAFLNTVGVIADEHGRAYFDWDDPDVRLTFDGSQWSTDTGWENHPMREVSWYGADAYCRCWDGGRLPTEAEWEKAARWDENAQYSWRWPWSDEFDNDNADQPTCDPYLASSWWCNESYNGGPTTYDVGSFPGGASSYGALDMAGNVWEWTTGGYASYPGVPPLVGPFEDFSRHVQRGGSWTNSYYNLRGATRSPQPHYITDGNLGFRVCYSAWQPDLPEITAPPRAVYETWIEEFDTTTTLDDSVYWWGDPMFANVSVGDSWMEVSLGSGSVVAGESMALIRRDTGSLFAPGDLVDIDVQLMYERGDRDYARTSVAIAWGDTLGVYPGGRGADENTGYPWFLLANNSDTPNAWHKVSARGVPWGQGQFCIGFGMWANLSHLANPPFSNQQRMWVDWVRVQHTSEAPVVYAGSNHISYEGAVIGLQPASFTDTDASQTHTATIDWGDGSPEEPRVVTQTDGLSGTVSGMHVYGDDGMYAVTVEITDSLGAAGSNVFLVTLANLAPIVNAGPDQNVLLGDAVTLDDALFAEPGRDDTHTAIVDWGDSTPPEPVEVTPPTDTAPGTVLATHLYANSGLYTVTLIVTDDDGASDSDTLTVSAGSKPVLTGAVSRKTHTGTGAWDIDVGIGDIESRSAQLGTANPNELLIVATFDIDVDLLGASDVTTNVGTVTGVVPGVANNELEITITDLDLVTQVNLNFGGVIDASNVDPAYASESTLCVRVIVGDYDNMGRTNFIDFAKIKGDLHINQLVADAIRARADFDCSGRPNFLDFAQIRNAGLLNQTAPACPAPPIGP